MSTALPPSPAPAPPRGRIVIAHPDRRVHRALHRLIGPAQWPVEGVTNLEALAAAVDGEVIAIVDAGLARTCPELRSRPAHAWIAVHGDGREAPDPQTVETLLGAGWTHVAAHPLPLLAEELPTTLFKLTRREAFGLEKYLAWGADVRGYTLENARDRIPAVAALSEDVRAVALPERADSLARVIADELLANALYAAPVDEAGRRFRAREERDRPRALTGREAVTLRWGTDARYLAIEVRDRWGSLDEVAITRRLVSGMAAENGGGMGLTLVYACCTQLVIGTVPSVCTEVIALLDLRFSPEEIGRSTSFHAFRSAEAIG